MEIERLRKDELIYELKIGRGAEVSATDTVERLRVLLKSAIDREKKGQIFIEGIFDIEEELVVGAAKLEEIEQYFADPNDHNHFRIRTLLFHLNGRFVRLLSQCTGKDRNECKKMLIELKKFSADFKTLGSPNHFKAPSVVTVSAMQSEAGSVRSFATRSVASQQPSVRPEQVSLPPSTVAPSHHSADPVHNLSGSLAGLFLNARGGAIPKAPRQVDNSRSGGKSVAFHKWNVTFSGQRDESVNSFIMRIEELADARGVSDAELLRGAPELFAGPALVWYRSVRDQISDWESLKTLLKKEFLPVDYQASLLEEIRSRHQGVDESSSAYIACMLGLFDRLEFVVPEKTKLELVIRNMSPFYLKNLAWQSIISINHLKEEARTLEVKKSLVDRYEQGHRPRSLLEPDLAYKKSLPPSFSSSKPFVQSSKPFVQPNKPFVAPRRPAVSEVEVPPATPEEVSEPAVDAVSGFKFVCWNCKDEGHSFTKCSRPKNRFCHKCGYQNVVTSECPSCNPARSGNES